MTTDQHADPSRLDPRDAVAQIATLSFDDASMETMLQRIAELAKKVIPGVAEASITLVSNYKAASAAFTGQLALDLDESQYGRGYGPCLEAAATGEVTEITDARSDPRWRDYMDRAVER